MQLQIANLLFLNSTTTVYFRYLLNMLLGARVLTSEQLLQATKYVPCSAIPLQTVLNNQDKDTMSTTSTCKLQPVRQFEHKICLYTSLVCSGPILEVQVRDCSLIFHQKT